MTQTTVTVFSWFEISLYLLIFFLPCYFITKRGWSLRASTPCSHGLSQPIDQCKSKPVTSGHDILWLDFKCVYRSESLCTCRQKHWGCRPTHNARRFQLHPSICQGASELWPLWKQRAAQEHARPLPSGRHGSAWAAALNTRTGASSAKITDAKSYKWSGIFTF